jgi:hypothetical protein
MIFLSFMFKYSIPKINLKCGFRCISYLLPPLDIRQWLKVTTSILQSSGIAVELFL